MHFLHAHLKKSSIINRFYKNAFETIANFGYRVW